MAATAAEFQDLLEPKYSNIWHDSWPKYPSKYSEVFNIRSMEKNTITDTENAGFGSLQTQTDGAEVTFDDPIRGNDVEYTYIVRALAYKIHERLWRNDLYDEVDKFEKDLMDSSADDIETSAAVIFNNAFATTYNTGFDGLALCSTAHTRLDGGTNQQNNPSTDEALSVSALHNAYTTILKWKNHRGRPRMFTPKTLLIPPDLANTAYEILDSQLHPENANNTKNIIVNRYGLAEPIIWNYLTSTTAWFMLCTEHDLNFFWKFRPETGMETEWKTDSINRKVRQGYVVGFGKWEGVYGTDGVA